MLGVEEETIKTLVGNLKGKGNLRELDVNGRIILKWILKI
jgi:hypothetical protein